MPLRWRKHSCPHPTTAGLHVFCIIILLQLPGNGFFAQFMCHGNRVPQADQAVGKPPFHQDNPKLCGTERFSDNKGEMMKEGCVDDKEPVFEANGQGQPAEETV